MTSFENRDSHQMDRNSEVVERYRTFRQLTEPEEVTLVRDRDDEYQTLRHVVLLLVLSCSMFVVCWLNLKPRIVVDTLKIRKDSQML